MVCQTSETTACNELKTWQSVKQKNNKKRQQQQHIIVMVTCHLINQSLSLWRDVLQLIHITMCVYDPPIGLANEYVNCRTVVDTTDGINIMWYAIPLVDHSAVGRRSK